jgi:hypothetical protein
VKTGEAPPGGQLRSTASMHSAEHAQKRSSCGSKSVGASFLSSLIIIWDAD